MIQVGYRQRLGLLTLLFGCFGLLLVARLTLLQVIERDAWAGAAEDLRSGWRAVRPVRGSIVDARGEVLAHDAASFDLAVLALPWSATRYECTWCGAEQFADEEDEPPSRCRRCRPPRAHLDEQPWIVPADEREVRNLARLAEVPVDELVARIERAVGDVQDEVAKRLKAADPKKRRQERVRLMHDFGRRPRAIVRDVSYEVAREIDLHPRRYPAFRILTAYSRRYPGGPAFAHLLGRVLDTREEGDKRVPNSVVVERDDGESTSLVLPRGARGLEFHLESELRGEPGWVLVERDPRRRQRRVIGERPPRHGSEVRLTIDRRVQERAVQALGAVEGAFVVVEVETGHVIALASAPSFDPDDYARTWLAWSKLTDPQRALGTPLVDRAFRSFHAPGSILKPFTAMAAQLAGAAAPGEEIVCEQDFVLDGRVVGNLRCNGHHGAVDMHRALVKSCNVYFQTLMVRMLEGESFPVFEEVGRRFGFGRPTGIEAEQAEPWFPDHWRFDEIRQTGTFVLSAVGQGPVLLSPAQVARAYAGLATGQLPRLTVVRRIGPRALQPAREPLGMDEAARRRVVDALREVPGPGGTAQGSGLARWDIACKTGTAELVQGASLNNAWMAGYAPAQHGRPQVAFAMVVLRTHMHGGDACGPRLAQFFRHFYREAEE